MKKLNRLTHNTQTYTERILQFGEGNFLRAFADWMIHQMNQKVDFDAGVVAVQPIDKGLIQMLNEQDGLYTVYINGIKDGQAVSEHEVVDCIQRGLDPYTQWEEYMALAESPDLRFVLSNTTEAGIAYHDNNSMNDAPPSSFPAKVTLLLHRRYETFDGATDKGLIFIPCELIDRNGDNLKRIILQYAEEWGLSVEFKDWVEKHNIFANTLVDRIVPGYPKDKMEAITEELGYQDQLVVEGEKFHLWVIEGPEQIQKEFPAEACNLNVIFTDNMEPYRTRKVRILNGAHTTMVPVAYLYGIEYVRESVEDEVFGPWIRQAIFEEICPTLDLPEEELKSFACDVLDRFRNPYLMHALMSISLNSVSKFKTRVLPSLLEYVERKGKLPEKLCVSLAALIAFYRGEVAGKVIQRNDDQTVIDFADQAWASYSDAASIGEVVKAFLSQTDFWGQDLTVVTGLTDAVAANLTVILDGNIKKLITQ
ncbi:tagaturonate reductase [Reichenbachiella agarivorans]|uniref:Tagaturonate reductase n=1 Tax=Reichenbachiella agarivorans TaxID=2979464 RepID=A0ABY6CN88_9BACT|nr:tagaturonate reductase [Reichenbachiella agarivorans]UXP31983.1 tagaturonate reductase [Reichenbachiella agarivorans]